MATPEVVPLAEPVSAAPVDMSPVTETAEKHENEGKEKMPKVPKEKRPKVPKAPGSHPTYLQMIKEAIASLKERTGPSPYAIAKYLKDTYKTSLPHNFKKTLSAQLKNLTKNGKVIKVKYSFKLSEGLKKVPKPPKTAKTIKPPGTPNKVKKIAGRSKTVSKTKAAKRVTSPKVMKKATQATEVKPAKATNEVKPAKAPANKTVAAPAKPAKRKGPSPRRISKPAPNKASTRKQGAIPRLGWPLSQ